jgi:hypothetical protein
LTKNKLTTHTNFDQPSIDAAAPELAAHNQPPEAIATEPISPTNSQPLTIGGVTVAPKTKQRLDLPVARLPTQTMVSLPITVINGAIAGPRLWLSAAIHGDELNGVEIIRQVIGKIKVDRLVGTLIAAPIINVFGFLEHSRYLPDRRDLNRCFPGSPRGSLAAPDRPFVCN